MPIDRSGMQTSQTNQTIKQFAPKTIFLIFVKTGLLQYNTTNKGSRPEIQDDPGEMRGRKRETTIFNTTNKGPYSMSTSSFCRDKFFRREVATSEERNHQVSRGGTTVNATIKGSILTQIVRTLDKRTKVNKRPRCYPESEKLKVLPDFPNLRSESRQYDARKAL